MSSFIADKIVMDGLTFDDVLLIPAYSEVLPKTVELKTLFSRIRHARWLLSSVLRMV